jgi:hypothetical protein
MAEGMELYNMECTILPLTPKLQGMSMQEHQPGSQVNHLNLLQTTPAHHIAVSPAVSAVPAEFAMHQGGNHHWQVSFVAAIAWDGGSTEQSFS